MTLNQWVWLYPNNTLLFGIWIIHVWHWNFIYLYIINIILCLNLFQPLKTIHIIRHSQARGACSPAPAVGPRDAGQIGKRFCCSRTDGEREDGVGKPEDHWAEWLRQGVQPWPHRQRSAKDSSDCAGGQGQPLRCGSWVGRRESSDGDHKPFPGGQGGTDPMEARSPSRTQPWPQILPERREDTYADRALEVPVIRQAYAFCYQKK